MKTSVDTRNSRLVGFAALSLKDGSDHGLIKQLGIFVISDLVLHLKKGPKKRNLQATNPLAKEKIEKTSKPIEKTKIEKAEKARHELHGIWTEQTFFLDVTNWKKWEVVPKNRTNPGYEYERTRIENVRGFKKGIA